MPNSLFNQIGNHTPMNGMVEQLTAFRQNPMQFLIQRRINIPQEYANDPRGAVQYLMNQGKLSQSQFNQLSQMAQQMGVRLN